jgi:hypothetical protein
MPVAHKIKPPGSSPAVFDGYRYAQPILRLLFIRQLLSEVFHASGIVLEMPDKRPDTPVLISSAAHQDTGQLLAFLAEPGDADCEPESSYRRR